MICKHCGYENDNYAEFCVNCGASLKQEAYADQGTQVFNDGNGNYGEGGYGGYEEFPVVEKKPADVLGIVGLVLGILSIVGGCCCSTGANLFLPIIGSVISGFSLIFAVAGLIVSAIGISKAKKAGNKSVLSIVGLVLAIVMLLINIALLVVSILAFAGILGLGAVGAMSDMMYY